MKHFGAISGTIVLAGFAVFLATDLRGQSSIDLEEILLNATGKVVHLRVRGTQAVGETFGQPLHGTGIVIRTSSTNPRKRYRILTAGHVVKADNAWVQVSNRRDRDVFITTEDGVGTGEKNAIAGVLVDQQNDVAQVVASPLTIYSAEFRSMPLVPGQAYAVVTWGLDDQQKIAKTASAKVVEVVGPDDINPKLVRLKANLVPTESGSPVLDKDGTVIAIVLMREVVGGSHQLL